MNILHITLGNPKQHSGGLNRYCKDLMEQQIKDGHSVKVLYAGIHLPGKKVKIKKKSNYEFLISGALPVAVTYGIDNPKRYMMPAPIETYRKWLAEIQPQVIHIHSFMGIHKEFFVAAKALEIPMIFTTHDYYPCCFRCNLVNQNSRICMRTFEAKQCCICNYNAGLNVKTQILLQSEFYQWIKNFSVIEKLKKKQVVSINVISKQENKIEENPCLVEEFEKLHSYYSEIMQMMTGIHCNSQLTKRIYEKHYPNLKYHIMDITHSGIISKTHLRKSENILHISYFGGMNQYKGFFQLRRVLDRLLKENEGWDITLYGGSYVGLYIDEKIKIGGMFSSENENVVWENTDLLIVPSQCPETFGFVVLEALAHGIPVICSDFVGAGYLLERMADDCIYHHEADFELLERIKRFLNPDYYQKVQSKIEKIELQINMATHCKKMLDLYNQVLFLN